MNEIEIELEYHAAQQFSRQWGGFLQALAGEFEGKIDAGELRALMYRVGQGMAKLMSAPQGDSLKDLEASMNGIWFNMNWGWVRLQEMQNHLLIEHYAAPLANAFGSASMPWAAGLLEGIYGEWLAALGADSALRLRQFGEPRGPGQPIEFRFGKGI